ncbi:hypothetical protein AX16_002363 [Volvariella volvacea WC 439]|nr:hypothetical protein AX16_002363 [Volvariella volvacea WC 439]
MSNVEQPHLVSLVLQSRKALQHGEQLCSRAHSISQQSSQVAIDVLALDAKVRWLTDAVVEQLKLAVIVAKSLEEKQAHLNRQVQAWDTLRNARTDELDSILDSLGAQTVPSSFHQTSADSSLFGSQPATPPSSPFQQPSDLGDEPFSASPPQPGGFTNSHASTSNGHVANGSGSITSPDQSPTTTLRNVPIPSLTRKGKERSGIDARIDVGKRKAQKVDRKHWKTLRDFVDDKAIELMLDTIEQQRLGLDLLLGKSLLYPESLRKNVNLIYESLPTPRPPLHNNQSTHSRSWRSSRHAQQAPQQPKLSHQFIEEVLSQQDTLSSSMAANLEGLASLYDQMASALSDSEGGEAFIPEDMPAIERDIQELPTVITELEENAELLEHHFQTLLDARTKTEGDLELIQAAADSLDELGEIMSSMVSNQDVIESEMEAALALLHDQLHAVSELHENYVSYEKAFSKLVLELQRRVQYRDSMEMMVREMSERLQRLTEGKYTSPLRESPY